MSQPNFAEFALNYTPDQAAIDTLVAGRRRLYVPTGEELRGGGDQVLPVYATIPEVVVDPTAIIRPMPWSDDGGRPEGALYDAYVAALMERPVITVGSPSVDSRTWADAEHRDNTRLSPGQKEQLGRGRFGRVGLAVARAVAEAQSQKLFEAENFSLLTSSMASAIGAGAVGGVLADKVNLPLRALTFVETVNVLPRSRVNLGRHFLKENASAPGYLEQNPQSLLDANEGTPAWLKRAVGDAMARAANFAYFGALAKGGFRADVGDQVGALGELSVPVHLARGGASNLSTEAMQKASAQHFTESGVEVDQVTYPGHTHAFTMTVSYAVQSLRRVL